MKKETINQTILKYLRHLTNSEWILKEAYKFEFANFLQSNVDFQKQTDAEVLEILLRSQTIKYDKSRGIAFIQKSGRKKLKTFLKLNDIQLLRQFETKNFDAIDWDNSIISKLSHFLPMITNSCVENSQKLRIK